MFTAPQPSRAQKKGPKPIRASILRLAAICLIATLAAGQALLATFNGSVHAISKKQITIETAEGNLLDFDINRKTRVLRGNQQIALEDLQTGDPVTIQAKQEMARYLTAVTVAIEAASKK